MTAYATTVPVWTALTAYLAGGRVQPVTADQTVWVVTVAGTSGAAQPTWPTAEPWTVVDGTVTWQKASSARRQMRAGIMTNLTAFKTANPTMLLDVVAARPQSIAALAMPAAYLGAINEVVTAPGALQTRTISADVILIDIVPDSLAAIARSADLIDGIDDYFSRLPHTSSGFSITRLANVIQAAEADGATTYLAHVLTFEGTFTEGRT